MSWSRLEQLVAERRPSELREFWRLYRAATSRLAALQAEGRSDEEAWYLNRLVGAAHAVLYRSARERSAGREAIAFLSRGWPARVRAELRLVGLAAALFAAGGAAGAFYAARDPGFLGLVAPPELIASVERGEMWTGEILSVAPAASSFLFANNLTVAVAAFALGITGGLGTAWLLAMNGVMLGAIAWSVGAAGMAADFWGFVVPHGVLELPAIFFSGAAGLVLARGMLFPGARPWSRAVPAAARDALALFAGCAPVLLVAAGIEAWVSPESWPFAAKAALGAVLGAGLVAWVMRPLKPDSPSAP
ncbi:MAG: stage II sporulation protein M [Candidatus Eiseniibacteriota bacterium]